MLYKRSVEFILATRLSAGDPWLSVLVSQQVWHNKLNKYQM